MKIITVSVAKMIYKIHIVKQNVIKSNYITATEPFDGYYYMLEPQHKLISTMMV